MNRSLPLALIALTTLAGGCKQPAAPATPDASAMELAQKVQDNRGTSLRPPARQPGPPRPEAPEKIAATSQLARKLVQDLLKAGIPPREVASVADTRGYRLFHWRYFQQARAWFEEAVRVDPTYELSLYNAARCTAALGDHKASIAHLATLEKLDTPLSRSRLVLGAEDPDLLAMQQKLQKLQKVKKVRKVKRVKRVKIPAKK